MVLVAGIMMLERKIPAKAQQSMEQLTCQVHVVLVVQNHQLKLTNNPLACLSRCTNRGYIHVHVHDYYIISHTLLYCIHVTVVVVIIAHLIFFFFFFSL